MKIFKKELTLWKASIRKYDTVATRLYKKIRADLKNEKLSKQETKDLVNAMGKFLFFFVFFVFFFVCDAA